MEHAGGTRFRMVFSPFHHQRVAGVVAAVEADHDVGAGARRSTTFPSLRRPTACR